MIEDECYQKLRDYALKLLSFRPRSSKEIKGKLTQFSVKKSIPQKTAARVINDLVSQNFINDEEFAVWWFEQRRTFRPKGEKLIQMELQQKGIDKEIIVKALKETAEGKKGEFESALEVASKKIDRFQYLPFKKRKIKISNLLAHRGFSWETIHKVIDSLVQKS